MGCYNTTGFVSGLNVRCGDPIVAIPCVVTNKRGFSAANYYTTTQITPISLPIFGTYNDYGGIENVENTPSANAWKRCVCNDIESSINLFERANVWRNTLAEILGHEKQYITEGADEIEEGLNSVLKPTDRICLIIEHKGVYEKLASKPDADGSLDFFNDIAYFNCLLQKCGIDADHINMGESAFSTMLVDAILKNPDDIPDEYKTISKTGSNLSDKYKYKVSLSDYFFNWHIGFNAYKKNIWDIEGIAKAFSDFSIFDMEIAKLNIGYRVPSCGCGGQNDYNHNVIEFYDFLKGFYENNLKEEEYEEE